MKLLSLIKFLAFLQKTKYTEYNDQIVLSTKYNQILRLLQNLAELKEQKVQGISCM